MTTIGRLIRLDTRLQAVASAMERARELEQIYGRARLQKSKSEAGYKWRALQRDINSSNFIGAKAMSKRKFDEDKAVEKLLKVRGVVAVNRNGEYVLRASHDAKTDAELHNLLSDYGWKIEAGEFIGLFETTIKVTLPPAIKVKIPPLVLTLSENKNEDSDGAALSSQQDSSLPKDTP
jgi:hypothetical protein